MNTKYIIAASIIAAALIGGALVARPDQAAYETSTSSISPYDIDTYYDPSRHTVLDVRTPEEYAQVTITEDPLNIDFYADNFHQQLDELDRDASYIVYCQSGNRSSQTVEIMQEMGFRDVVHLEGGIGRYIELSQR